MQNCQTRNGIRYSLFCSSSVVFTLAMNNAVASSWRRYCGCCGAVHNTHNTLTIVLEVMCGKGPFLRFWVRSRWCQGWGCGHLTKVPQGRNLPFGPEYSPRSAFPFRTPTKTRLPQKGAGRQSARAGFPETVTRATKLNVSHTLCDKVDKILILLTKREMSLY